MRTQGSRSRQSKQEQKCIRSLTCTRSLTLNAKKYNYVIFRPYQKKIQNIPKICIFDYDSNKNVNLECKDSIKHLGVLIDENLSWKKHIDAVITKISKTVGMLSKLRYYIPFCVLTNIYNGLITPYISYGLISRGHASKTHLNKLIILQKRALRLIHFADRNEHAIPNFSSCPRGLKLNV